MNEYAPGTIHLDSVTIGYRGRPAIVDVTGCFEAGSMTAVHGPNGAGKTTLLEAMAGLLRPQRGGIRVAPRTRIAYLPQQSHIDRSFPVSVNDVVALGTWSSTGVSRRLGPTDDSHVTDALRRLGITDLARTPIAFLSAGQFQRVLFARAVVQDADVLLLDEPFNAVDSRTVSALVDVLHALHSSGRTIVAVLHDPSFIRDHFPRTLLLKRRCVAWDVTSVALDPHRADAVSANEHRRPQPLA